MPYTSPGSLGEAWAGPGSLGGSNIQWVCLGMYGGSWAVEPISSSRSSGP